MKRFRTDDIVIDEHSSNETSHSFSQLYLNQQLHEVIEKSYSSNPSPIQWKTIPFGRQGFDIIAQAKSGTGKTIAFASIVLDDLYNHPNQGKTAIVLSPTREIAEQTAQVFSSLASTSSQIHVQCFIGGVLRETDIEKCNDCTIAVGTPGRLFDLINSGKLSTENVSFLVFDEADALLSKLLRKTVLDIFNSLPETAQFLAYSATYSDETLSELQKMAKPNVKLVLLDAENPSLKGVKHFNCFVEKASTGFHTFEAKFKILLKIFETIDFSQCIVFCDRRDYCESLCLHLSSLGWSTVFIGAQSYSDTDSSLSKVTNQKRRSESMRKLRDFEVRIAIATDLISRGIDLSNVNLIVNLDIPTSTATYLHRVGRTGRFGTLGIVISMYTKGEEQFFETLTNECHVEFLKYSPGDIVPRELYDFEREKDEKAVSKLKPSEASSSPETLQKSFQYIKACKERKKEETSSENKPQIPFFSTTGFAFAQSPIYPFPHTSTIRFDDNEWEDYLTRRKKVLNCVTMK